MVRNVVGGRSPVHVRMRLLTGGVPKAAHERTPGDAGGGEQITDIFPGHLNLRADRTRADIAKGIRVADHRTRVRRVRDEAAAPKTIHDRARKGVAGDEVEETRSRGTEGGAEGIIAQREVLSIVPQRGHGVA